MKGTSPGKVFFLLLIILLSSTIYAFDSLTLPTHPSWENSPFLIYRDTPPVDRPKKFRKIKTNEYMAGISSTDERGRQSQYELKKWIKEQAKAAKKLDGVEIPIVFHVLYSDPMDKITEDQIYSQLEALNRDFGDGEFEKKEKKKNEDVYKKAKFDRLATAMNIGFCLGNKEDKKKKEIIKGIQYYEVGKDGWTYDNAIKDPDRGGIEGWDSRLYLNVWVARLADTVSGFAQMPGWQSHTDGIVIDHRFLGSRGSAEAPYDEGKTLTHLVANTLGVRSLWSYPNPCLDDDFSETPLHNAPNYGCPGIGHVSACYGNPSELTMNFLDNTDDACMYMFTTQQVHQMHAVLSKGGSRYDLWKEGGKACKEKEIPDQIEEKKNSVSYLSVYPNPAKSYLTLESGQIPVGEKVQVSIVDMMGRTIWRGNEMEANSVREIDCSSWDRGIYFVVINHEVSQPYQKVILQ